MDTETTQSSIEISKSNEMLFHLLNKLTTLHDLADKKAYAALTIIGAIMLIAPQYIEKFINNVASIHSFWQCLAYLLTLLFIAASGVGLHHVIRVLAPRINSSKPSIIFWGQAASLDLEKLKKEWVAQTDAIINERLIIEYHSNAKIAVEKFKHCRLALYAAIIAVCAFFILATSSLTFAPLTPSLPIQKQSSGSMFTHTPSPMGAHGAPCFVSSARFSA